MSTHNIFLWVNKKNINTFWLKEKNTLSRAMARITFLFDSFFSLIIFFFFFFALSFTKIQQNIFQHRWP